MSHPLLRTVAAAILVSATAFTALAPTVASAHMGFGGGHFGGWGHGWGHGYYAGYRGCWPRRFINSYGEVVIVSGCY